MPLNDLFKDGVSLDPDKTDSVIQNTKYILVELAELDTTLKADQGKKFLASPSTHLLLQTPYQQAVYGCNGW